MSVPPQPDRVTAERERILSEYRRRDADPDRQRYASDSASVLLEQAARRRTAEAMLRSAGAFPDRSSRALEIGCGAVGWGADLLGWGIVPAHLHGIDVSATRIAEARRRLPGADLRVGDAAALPWPDRSFQLVIASTVFTSILDAAVRRRVADEIVRVLTPGGALLWYDFAFNNPRNPGVRKVDRRELRQLFPELAGKVRSITLAPPLARAVAPWSRTLAEAMAAVPFLRTHLLAVLQKPR